MKKEYAVQTRNKEHSTKWDDYSDIVDTQTEAKKLFNDQLSRSKAWRDDKKITRLVSFVVNDHSVPLINRPAQGCTILEVLDYHEDK